MPGLRHRRDGPPRGGAHRRTVGRRQGRGRGRRRSASGAAHRALVAEGGQAIISFGIAAGLAPSLAPGTCLVGGEVVHDGTSLSRRCGLGRAALRRRLGSPEPVAIAGVDHPLTSASAKRALNAETGAVAADMESHIVAQLATRAWAALCGSARDRRSCRASVTARGACRHATRTGDRRCVRCSARW